MYAGVVGPYYCPDRVALASNDQGQSGFRAPPLTACGAFCSIHPALLQTAAEPSKLFSQLPATVLGTFDADDYAPNAAAADNLDGFDNDAHGMSYDTNDAAADNPALPVLTIYWTGRL